MAKVITEKFDEMVLEVEGPDNTWTILAGLVGIEVSRTANVQSTEVPDDTDESVPHYMERAVTGLEVSVSATGVWARTSHERMQDWFYSGQPVNARIGNKAAAVGDTRYETGPALLTSLGQSREKGKAVEAAVEIMFTGTPARTAAA